MGAASATLRHRDGRIFVTDNGNHIYDCRFSGGLDDPVKLEAALQRRAGVAGTGLFIGIASVALLADEGRVEVHEDQ